MQSVGVPLLRAKELRRAESAIAGLLPTRPVPVRTPNSGPCRAGRRGSGIRALRDWMNSKSNAAGQHRAALPLARGHVVQSVECGDCASAKREATGERLHGRHGALGLQTPRDPAARRVRACISVS